MTITTISRSAKGLTLRLSQIEIPPTARPYNATAVVELSRSIAAIGLQSPPTVIERDGRFVLVAGRHRHRSAEAARHSERSRPLVDFDDVEAQHVDDLREFVPRGTDGRPARRAGRPNTRELAGRRSVTFNLGKLRRMKASGKTVAVIAMKAATALRLATSASPESEVRRAKTIAALPEETKQAARETGSTTINPLS